MKTAFCMLICIITFPGILHSQAEKEDPLEEYIEMGLENNLSLKQKETNWKEAELKLKEAKGLFYPDISLNARYTVADGGRIIDFPVGDLLNPVYSTLNMLTMSNEFPQIENEEFPFLRPTEHETKLRLVQPLLNTDIFFNKKIKKNTLNMMFSDMQSYKRELVFEIKQAYYNYMNSIELLQLLENTIPVLEENMRVNEKLFKNDKITQDILQRSGYEISKIEEKIAEARGSKNVAEAYFNFLLNRKLDESIISSERKIPEVPADLQTYIESAVSSREDLKKLEKYIELTENNLNRNRAARLPEISAVVDYGFQGEEYKFDDNYDFIMASVILKWDLFKGFQEKSRISEAMIANKKAGYQIEEAREMVKLEVMNSWYDFFSSVKKLESSENNVEISSEIFRMVNKKYAQNQSSLLEFMDARNNMTMAKQNMIINTYDSLIKYSAFEKAAGLYDMHKY